MCGWRLVTVTLKATSIQYFENSLQTSITTRTFLLLVFGDEDESQS